jgi:hypothetical protein
MTHGDPFTTQREEAPAVVSELDAAGFVDARRHRHGADVLTMAGGDVDHRAD